MKSGTKEPCLLAYHKIKYKKKHVFIFILENLEILNIFRSAILSLFIL